MWWSCAVGFLAGVSGTLLAFQILQKVYKQLQRSKAIAWFLILIAYNSPLILRISLNYESQMQAYACCRCSLCVVCRKLPFLALSLYCPPLRAGPVPLPTFLAALTRAANRMQHDLTATNAVFSHI
jgi:hypothetical protein